MANYEAMSNDALLGELRKLSEARAAIKARMKAITVVLDKRAIEKKVAGMSDAEKTVIAQVLQPKGIESEEALGIPKSG